LTAASLLSDRYIPTKTAAKCRDRQQRTPWTVAADSLAPARISIELDRDHD
jgi:hypothetical protein